MSRRVKGRTGDAAQRTDGRSTRWSSHRESRREQLVEAAVAAIDAHGPDAGLDEIAAAAGVSKPVLYRYFADKAAIHSAVGQWGAGLVMERLLPALLTAGSVRRRVELAVDAYLATIEEHPNVFLLLVRHRAAGDTDPIADGKAAIASALSRFLGDALRELGVDAGGAEPWAHGLVGLGLATGEWWLDRQTMSRAHVGGYLTDFVWHALEGVARSHGVDIDGDTGLRLVATDEPTARDEAPTRRERS
ncbi:MAG TPA: TetR/AcrR family transcriptional regulator [Nocardioidaceae bacterium]|jgi:AcrR family transcriptional regulator